MRYLSVCSGIEAATAAWRGLGWECAGLSEIEPFPRAVLERRLPGVPNFGDMTRFKEWPLEEGGVDLLVGGCPCQAFSIAGLRKGLDDPRGNLTLVFLGLVDRLRPRYVVYENVPGILSDRTGAFRIFLRSLAEMGYAFDADVLDAKFFGVPQRRRRVFVAAVRGDLLDSLEAKDEGFADGWLFGAGDLAAGGDNQLREAARKVEPALRAVGAGGGGACDVPAFAAGLRWNNRAGGAEWEADPAAADGGAVAVNENMGADIHEQDVFGTCGGSKPGLNFPCVMLNSVGSHGLALDGESGTLTREGTRVGFQLRAALQPVCLPVNTMAMGGRRDPANDARMCRGIGEDGDPKYTLGANHSHAVFVSQGRFDMREVDISDCLTKGGGHKATSAPLVCGDVLRRLTPVECERLQGFPDDWTRVAWRGRPEAECPDGPRYRALGNSMAVPVMRFIGMRLAALDALLRGEA